MKPMVTISVVSHRQIDLVVELLANVRDYCKSDALELIVTLNLPENLPFTEQEYSVPVRVIRNTFPLGFGENHNQAFKQSAGRYFCVINPDIQFNQDPFPALLACLQDLSVGVIAPVVVGPNGEIDDSARRFPGPVKILCKALGGCRGSDYQIKDEIVFPDWVAGMFMLFRREVFEKLGGFDERYFLYYEDVDLCARLRLSGYEVALCQEARVIHHAQRSSHRNLKYMKWHLTSMLRYFFSGPFLKVCWLRLKKPPI